MGKMYKRGSRRYGVCWMYRPGTDWMEYNVNNGEMRLDDS
jgi:hypothetical protein